MNYCCDWDPNNGDIRISGLSVPDALDSHPDSDIRAPGYSDSDPEIQILYNECIFDIKVKKRPLYIISVEKSIFKEL